jgi:hypothetical protein
MRIPIILMLLTVLLLPADLRGLADDVQAGIQTASAAISKFLKRGDDVQVAEADATPAQTTKLANIQ